MGEKFRSVRINKKRSVFHNSCADETKWPGDSWPEVKISGAKKSPAPCSSEPSHRRRQKTILVPIDFSSEARHGLANAIAFGGASRLILLHVVPPLRENGQRLEDMIQSARIRLSEFARRYEKETGGLLEWKVRAGTPFQEILSFSRRENIDLIVLAIDPSSPLGGIALGHTADRVLRYASCPVLLVRDPAIPRALNVEPDRGSGFAFPDRRPRA